VKHARWRRQTGTSMRERWSDPGDHGSCAARVGQRRGDECLHSGPTQVPGLGQMQTFLGLAQSGHSTSRLAARYPVDDYGPCSSSPSRWSRLRQAGRPISAGRVPAASSQLCVLENLTKVVSHRACKARWREVEQFGKRLHRASHVNRFRRPAINLSERTVRLREHSINWE
jgi:hypothetical protein